MTSPVIKRGAYYLAELPDSGRVNARVLTQFAARWRAGAVRGSHYFCGRYENLFGFTPMDGFHVKGMPEDKLDILPLTQVRKPVPGEDAFDGNHKVFPIRCHHLGKVLWRCGRITMRYYFASLIEDADIHGAGM